MLRLILLFMVILSGMAFIVIPDDNALNAGFPFSRMKLTYQTYWYFLLEGLAKVVFAYIIYTLEPRYRFAMFVLTVILALDVIDYVLSYNGVWFKIGTFPVSMNTVGILVFAFAIIHEMRER